MDDLALRIGDVERRAVDARLQAAVGEGFLSLPEYEERVGRVWRSVTRADLQAVLRDLPGQPLAPAVRPAPVGPREAPRRPARVLAVLSEDRMTGPVAPGQGVEAYTVMGRATLDLRRDDLPAEVRVRVVSVMGEVQVLVPRGVAVHLSGLTVMGQRALHLDEPEAGAPVVHIDAYAVMAAVDVGHGGAPDPGRVSLTKAPPAPLSDDRSGSVAVPQATHRLRARDRGRRRPRSPVRLALVVGGGIWAAQADAASVFGSSTYRVSPGESVVDAGVLFGSVEVVVPDGTTARSTGVTPFGSSECDAACGPGTGPVMHVRRFGAFGSITVLTQAEYDRQQAEDRGDDASGR